MNLLQRLAARLFTHPELPTPRPLVDNGTTLAQIHEKLAETKRVGADVAQVAYTSQTLRRQNHFSTRIAEAMKRTADES